MEEEPKNNQEIIRNDKGQFVEGQSGNPNGIGAGRPKGSISIKDSIRKYYEEHPEEFKDLCKFYMTDEKMRDLLWKQLDGLPKASLDLETKGPIEIIITRAGEDANKNPT
jgi:hypothetical protein